MLKSIREIGVKLSLLWDKKHAEEANKAINGIAASMKGIGAQAAAAAGTLFGFAEVAASNAFDLDLYSQTLGISSERLQELAYAAKVTANVSRDELMGALEGVSSTLDNVRKGNVDAALAFNRLGLSTDVITNRNLKADQVMMMVAERLKDIQDPIARASIANEVFGASGARMLPLLLKGASGIAAIGKEARDAGLIFGDKSVKQQAAFQVSLNKTLELLKHLGLVVGASLIPIVQKVLVQFTKWVQANRKLITEGLKGFIEGLTVLVPIVWKAVLGFTGFVKKLVELIGGGKRFTQMLVGFWALAKLYPVFSAVATAVGAIATALGVGVGAFLGWTAAVAAAGYAIYDLYKYFVGKDSYFGQIIEWFSGKFPNAAKLFSAIWTRIGDSISGAVEAIKGFWGYIKDIGEEVSKMLHIGEIFQGLKDTLSNLVSSGTSKASSLVDMIGSGMSRAADYISGDRQVAYARGAGGMTNTNNVQAQITVQVPPGTSPSTAAQIVSQGTEDGLQKVLRPTRNMALGGAAY